MDDKAIIEKIDSRMGRKLRLPYHSRDLYLRVSVRQPGAHNVHTLEFTVPNYWGSSHPTERDLQGTARTMYRALAREFGNKVMFGGVPAIKKEAS